VQNTDIHGPLNFPFPEQLPEQTYPPDEPEAKPAKTGDPPIVTAADVSASDLKVTEAINADAVQKSWVEALAPLLQKPPVRKDNRTVGTAYEGALIAIYDRVTRIMRSDLDREKRPAE